MKFVSRYQSHPTDDQGYVVYTQAEHETWQILYQRQIEILQGRAVNEFIHGLKLLNLSSHEIPQIPDLNQRLTDVSSCCSSNSTE